MIDSVKIYFLANTTIKFKTKTHAEKKYLKK